MKESKKTIIFTLTKNGYELSKKISKLYFNSKVFTLYKYYDGFGNYYENNFKEEVKKQFYKNDILIFIMASGIVVRSIAELIKDKKNDPAIVVLDDNAKNVISLLSGHIGGGNEETLYIAENLKSNPVITTASDVNSKLSVDMLAKEFNLKLLDFNMAKIITSKFLDEEEIVFIVESSILRNLILDKYKIKSYLSVSEAKFNKKNFDELYKIIISNKKIEKIDKTIQLFTKNIVIGIGCKNNTLKNDIYNFILEILDKLKISKFSIKHISTVDIKKDEIGLIEASKELSDELIIVSREDIKLVEHKYKGSEFVKKTIGVNSVSEPCAELTSKKGRFLVRKEAKNGVTISIWEEEYEW